MFLILELLLTCIGVIVAFATPGWGGAWFEAAESRFSKFAQNQLRAVAVVGIAALGIRAALLPILPVPQPEVHDEYSYLLLSDTLAHGRLANPTHPMWVHFETFHENWRPKYASMYYPGAGLFLALGQVVLGHPFWGVWLSSGLMCAAICWALQGWLPAEWALLGATLALIRLGTFSYWVDSYWGGTVTALGGALVLGSLPRIKRRLRVMHALLMALGMAILATTRPYEGLFFTLPFLVSLAWWASRREAPPARVLWTQVGLPVAAVMLLTFAALGYYFWRVTGSPFTTPYQVNMRTYGLVYFPWQKIAEIPAFHHTVMQELYRGGAVVGLYNFARQHPIEMQVSKQLITWLFFFGPILTMPWIVRLLIGRAPTAGKIWTDDFRFGLITWLTTAIASALTIYVGQPHYLAPVTATFYLLDVMVMRSLTHWEWHGRPVGRSLVRSVVLVCVALFIMRVAAPAFHLTPKPSWVRTWCSQDQQNLERARILDQLEHTPGNHLVIVRYTPNHDFILNEWVFNNADIDGSKVIWARDMGAENSELLQYFHDRSAWLVQPDYAPVKLSRYVK